MQSAVVLRCWPGATALVLTVACAESDPPAPEARVLAAPSCFAPAGLGAPSTIEDVVLLINTLPKPLTAACLVETLERPLVIDASSNVVSAQPAYGPNNPRIFLLRDDLVITMVPKGEGKDVVELSYRLSSTTSRKAEVPFPVAGEIDPAAPYDQIRAEGGTECGFCHLGEERDDAIDFADAYASQLLPIARNDRVELDYLEWVVSVCNPEFEPERCALLDAIFAQGQVVSGELGE
jgi:hypothetical protein